MSWILNLKTSAKLALGFGIVLAMMVAMAVVGVTGAGRAAQAAKDLHEDALDGISSIKGIYSEVLRFRMRHYRVILHQDQQKLAKGLAEIEEARKTVEEKLAAYEKTIHFDDERKLFGKLREAWTGYLTIDEGFFKLIREGKRKEAEEYIESKNRQHAKEVLEPALDAMVAFNEKLGDTRAREALATANAARTRLIGFGAVALLVALALATFLGKTIGSALSTVSTQLQRMGDGCIRDLMEGLNAMGQGDLTHSAKVHTEPLKPPAKDDLSAMMVSCNTLRERIGKAIDGYNESRRNLAAIVEQLSAAATQVEETSGALSSATEQSGRASTEIAQGSEKLATSAGEAASIMERLEATIHEVESASERQAAGVARASESLKQSADAVTDLAASAQGAAATAEEGRRKVEEIEREARRKVEQVLTEAEERSRRINEEASRKVKRVAEEAERRAERAEKEAKAVAERKAKRKRDGKGKGKDKG
ncbi:MAG: MCP four helix bundle domain-containing protein [Fimbriimonadales bacterium]|nr:MCP four helix bundle domain-containing protein [Fimbriimonadales bacterium]